MKSVTTLNSKKTTTFVLILLFVSNFLIAQIVNKGVLKIKDGTTVYFGEDYTNNAGATHDNEGELHLNGDFINDGIVTESGAPDLANGQTIFDSPTNANAVTNPIQVISGASNKVAFENLKVANTTGVSVADGTELIVEKGVNLVSGDLRLVGEAQLIQKHTGTTENTGTTKLLRDQQGTAVTFDYNYWSSPVEGSTANNYKVGEVLYDGTDANVNSFTPTLVNYTTGAPWNGTPTVIDGSGNVTTAMNIESYWIWKFDNGTIDDDNDWVLLQNTGSINVGLGYTMKGPDPLAVSGTTQNYVFKGKPNDGDYSLSIDSNKSSLIGNPYPSALDADAFINANATVLADVSTPDPNDPPATTTTGALYFWEHWGGGTHIQSGYQGGYATYTLAGGTPPTSHPSVNPGGSSSGTTPSSNYKIPVAQGFFVESVDGGTIVFNNSMRVYKAEGSTESHFFRPANNSTEIVNRDADDTTQRIRLRYDSPQNFHRQIMTAFIPECTDGHNIAYDARMADVNSEDMYWVTDGVPFVIDARPFGIDKQIPIGITVTNNGIHTISIDNVENFDEPIYILDTQTGFTYDLRQSNFEVNLTAGVYNNRFKLVFRPATVVGTNDLIASSMNVFYAPNSNNVVIDNFDKLTIKSAKIYNTIGQLIKVVPKKELENNKIIIPFNVASGTYFVNVETNIGKGDFKIMAY